MKLTKDGITEQVEAARIGKYLAHGWTEVKEKAVDEVIRLKPTVKTKNTAKILDDITTKGDE